MSENVTALPRFAVGKRTRADDVADHLTKAIESGEFTVGSELPSEKDIADRLGVGRPSVRQALFYLQQQGLVEVASGKRARVARPGFDFMQEQAIALVKRTAGTAEGQAHLEQVRLLYEPGIAMMAAMMATPEDIQRLKAKLDANVASVGSPANFIRTDVEFHFELTVITRNPIFRAIYDILGDWLIDQRANTIYMKDTDQLSVRDHTAIYEAVAAREPMRALHEMTAHLRLISELYREATEISDSMFRTLVAEVSRRVENEMKSMWQEGRSTTVANSSPKNR
jgi:GntR family transcriptional regulator, sialic acid-inducible nan operon repressor